MAQLPRTQPEAVELTQQMIDGFTKHPDTFHSANVPGLQEALDTFHRARMSFLSAESMFKHAGKQQKRAFESLKSVMSSQIRAAELDTADQPVKLGLIGFGPRRKKSPISAPAQVALLSVEPVERQHIVRLYWKKGFHTGCGRPSNFLIESRVIRDGTASPWRLTGTAFDCDCVLDNQPTGVRIEYRVIAANRGGQSMPSNTVSVIL